MNEQEEEYQLINLMKNKISDTLFNNFEDEYSYLAIYALMQLAYDLANDASYFDQVCVETAVFYEEDREFALEEDYAQKIVRLCNGT
jgi:hypothetical protein